MGLCRQQAVRQRHCGQRGIRASALGSKLSMLQATALDGFSMSTESSKVMPLASDALQPGSNEFVSNALK